MQQNVVLFRIWLINKGSEKIAAAQLDFFFKTAIKNSSFIHYFMLRGLAIIVSPFFISACPKMRNFKPQSPLRVIFTII